MDADANAPVFATGELDVAADPETVWEVMTDIGRWPAWNPDITAATVQGPVQPGTSFRWKSGPGTIRSNLAGGPASDRAVLDRQDDGDPSHPRLPAPPSDQQRTSIVAAGALQVTLAAAAFVNFVGPLAYLLFGRRRT